ncbi:hypothetical protein ABVK25_007903 [Lepraria finkii]|uniref:60S ribosomal protein L6 n=1 Tax=Lepraria finkii TaxID=1340010 RepID=A0ABR4B1G9_9LECA
MSAKQEASKTEHKTKKFGKTERKIPHHTQKAKKFYPTEDEAKPRKVRKSIHAARPRKTLQPGSILILLAGRFRGKRVVLLKHLPQGVLLVTGPFKVNGVPLRRVNARYVIATSAKVELKGIDEKVVEKVGEEGYFTRDKAENKKGEDQFFRQGEMPKKKKMNSDRANDQKAVDKALLTTIKKEPHLMDYLGSTFSLRKGDRPHEMKW